MPSERDFYKVSLKIFLKNEQGEFLLLKCKGSGIFAGFWDMPGGSIEKDEFNMPFDVIIKREVAEEIGNVNYDLNLKPMGLGRFENVKKKVLWAGQCTDYAYFLRQFIKVVK